MKTHKLLKYFFAFIVFLLVLLVLLWYGINNFLIPRIILPWVKTEVIKMSDGEKFRFAVGDIDYHPYKGFLIKDFEFFLPRDKRIFSVKEVDLDLNYWAFLKKQLEITNFKIYDVDLVISRNRKGKSNVDPLLDGNFPWEKFKGDFALVLKEIDFYGSRIDFSDASNGEKVLKRSLANIDLSLKHPAQNQYTVDFSGRDEKENLVLHLDYDPSKKECLGKVKLQTPYFNEYKEYYLSQFFNGWQLEVENLAGNGTFVYKKQNLILKGRLSADSLTGRYGDNLLKGKGEMGFKVEYNKGKLNPKSFEIDVDGEDLSLFVGKHKIFGQGQIDLATDCQKIMIKRFTGKQVRNDFDLTGTFMFLPYGDLVLSGEAFGAENFFRLQLLPEERANFGWQLSTALSSFEIFGVVTDIKNLSFAVQLDGTLDLSEWDRGFSVHVGEPALVSMDVSADKLKGKVTFDGKLYGKASQPENWAGNLGLSFSDFSVYNIMPLDFVLNMTANKGTFQALIPTTPIYKGTCFGSLKLNAQKWGAELDLQNADIAYLYEINPGLKGLKGNFSAKLVLVGGWGDRNSVVGGGYLILKNGDLRKVAFISDAEEGIGKVVKGFSMPNFEKIEGNFDIKNGQVIFENIFCRASDLSIEISGKTSFDGTVNAVAGVRMFGGSTLKTLRQIILPVTIGFDLVANSIQINIKGKIPDLSQTTQVMPMNWLGEFFNLNYKADPNRYSLDKLWQ